MRFFLYFIIISQSLAIVYLTHLMQDRPFSNTNMRSAYFNGCYIGQHYGGSNKFTCEQSADTYKYYLDMFDEQNNEP